MTKVTSIKQLREMVENDYFDYFVALNYGLRSSKTICMNDDGERFDIVNEIDGTEQTLSEEELMDRDLTNIGYAIQNGALYCYD